MSNPEGWDERARRTESSAGVQASSLSPSNRPNTSTADRSSPKQCHPTMTSLSVLPTIDTGSTHTRVAASGCGHLSPSRSSNAILDILSQNVEDGIPYPRQPRATEL